MAVYDLKTDEYVEKAVNSKIPVLIDFYATWCGPCKMLVPHISALSEELEGKVGVYRVNVDEEPRLAEIFGINSIPTLEIIKNGERVAESVGYLNADALRAFIEKNV